MPEGYNAELLQGLRSTYQARYEPNFAWVNALSAFTLLEHQRGFWPMSSVDENLLVYDHSGQSRNLTDNNTVAYDTFNLIPYAAFISANSEFLSRADEAGLSITGALTLGCWVRPSDDDPAAGESILGKWKPDSDERSYLLDRRPVAAGNTFRFRISALGTNASITELDSSVAYGDVGVTATPEQWYFVVGRYIPQGSMDLFVSEGPRLYEFTTDYPAGIDDNDSDFRIASIHGAAGVGVYELWGDVTLAFICASALDDVVIYSLFYQTKALFNANAVV